MILCGEWGLIRGSGFQSMSISEVFGEFREWVFW